jgi:cysteine synthase
MRAAEGLENAVWANQFDNIANQQAHYESTGRARYTTHVLP